VGLKLDLGLGVNSGNGVPSDYALEFNGTDEYLQIALPNNELLASAGTADFYSSGSAIAGWAATGIDWAGATSGKTYTNTIVGDANEFIQKTISGLVVGQKYKLKLRYQSADSFVISDGTTPYFTLQASTDWNTVSKIFTATGTTIKITSAGAWVLDYASVEFDQGFDLNKDQEQILHSRNYEFNNATTDWAALGNHSVSLSTTDKIGASGGSLLITASGAGDENNCVVLSATYLESCLRDKKYTLEGFGRSDTASRTLTMKMGSKQVTSSTLSTTSGSFTKAVLNFLATASEENADLKLWLSGAGNVFVDKLSLTQAYDYVIKLPVKTTDANGGLVSLGLGTGATDIAINLGIRVNIFRASNSHGNGYLSIYNNANPSGLFQNVLYKIDRTVGSIIYINGVAGTNYTDIVPKMIFTGAFQIGNDSVVGLLQGQISHLQIIRFENISQSTFNSAIKGLQYPTGGGAEEVLRLTFQDGSSIVNCLKDYSPKAHTVSGVLVDITNRKRVTR